MIRIHEVLCLRAAALSEEHRDAPEPRDAYNRVDHAADACGLPAEDPRDQIEPRKAHGRGVILLAICKSGAPLFEYTPNQVKQAVVGYGGADKHQVMEMTRRILKMEKVARPDDAADAIAIALCHARSSTSLLAQKGYR